MKPPITMVISDLDGTLLNAQKQISKLDQEMISKCKEKGILFGLASGRPVESIMKKSKEWGIDDSISFILGMNGGILYDVLHQEKEESYLLSDEVVNRILTFFEKEDCILFCYQGPIRYTSRSTQRTRKQAEFFMEEEVQVDIHSFIQGRSFNKVALYAEANRMPALLERINAFHDLDCVGYLVDTNLFEFYDPKVNKALGLRKLCERYGISPKTILAFGDATNDIPMIGMAGSGVCVQNATDDVKQVANYVSEWTNEESAVGHYLEENL